MLDTSFTGLWMFIPNLIADLDHLHELAGDREKQHDPEALQFSARVMKDTLAVFGMTKSRFGVTLGVTDEKSVRQWFTGQAMPRRGAIHVARLHLEQFVSPPIIEDAEGADSCAAAIGPHLERLMDRAKTAGWTQAQIVAAIKSWLSNK
jgi:hypothetical protein